MSVEEFWKTPAGHLEGTLAWKNAECCVAYNLMKLERLVFGWTGDARCMDAYERSLLNCRLGTQNADGLKQYFFPLAAGYWRVYNSAEESFWCCTGSGAEEFAKFTDTIFFHRGGDLFVNQFIASTLDWKEEGLHVEQVTQFPQEQGTTLKIKTTRATARTIHMRIPAWTAGAAEVKINGRAVEAVADPGYYLAIHRVWQDGDTVTISLPMELRQEALPGDESTAAVFYGPMVLAADLGPGPVDGTDKIIHSGDTAPKNPPAADPLPKAGAGAGPEQWVKSESKSELRFKAAGVGRQYDLLPMYQIRDQRYSVYWQIPSPKQSS
jgi:DUF1680 family protein